MNDMSKPLKIGDIEVKHFDYRDSVPLELELSDDVFLFLQEIAVKCEKSGFTLDDFFCSVLEYFVNNPDKLQKLKETEEGV